MDVWDDDTPPPLSSIPDQVHAAQLNNSIIGTAGLKEGELRTATTTSAPRKSVAQKDSFKRGFLNARPQQSSKKTAASSKPAVRVVKPQQQMQPGQKQIPAMFKLEPSEQQQRLDGMKKQLLDVLQPTPDTVEAISGDKSLLAGFDDPEVMAAVAEVARDPSAIKKYASNRKVQSFYQAFGHFVGNKLASLGGPDEASRHQNSSMNSMTNYLP